MTCGSASELPGVRRWRSRRPTRSQRCENCVSSSPTAPDRDDIAIRTHRYAKSLAMIEQQIPGSRLARLLRFELEGLADFPPQPTNGN
jgi:hypothetical protein